MKKIAMFGGTFNPIHNGHLCLAKTFVRQLQLDKVLLVPTYAPPHKQYQDTTSPEDRFQMCRLAAEDINDLEALDLEIKRQGPSYTVDTLCQLKKEHPEEELYLITGGDMFLTIQNWKEAQEIMRLAVICGVPRDRDDLFSLKRHARWLKEKNQARTVVLDMPPMAISSTEIRRMVRNGESIREWVPQKVERYIKEHKLYQKQERADRV